MRRRSRGPGRTRRPALPRHPVRRRSLAADLSPCGRAARTGLAVAAIGGSSAAHAPASQGTPAAPSSGGSQGAAVALAARRRTTRSPCEQLAQPLTPRRTISRRRSRPYSAQPPKAASPSRAASPDFRLRAASERLRPGAPDACVGRFGSVSTRSLASPPISAAGRPLRASASSPSSARIHVSGACLLAHDAAASLASEAAKRVVSY
jgi:hypothetical protein